MQLPSPSQAEVRLEDELKALGLTAPRVTPAWLDSLIEKIDYFKVGPSHIICKLTFFGGRFHTTGESATVSAENFDEKVGEEVSYRKARDAMWPYLGAVLAHELFRGRMPLTEEQQKLDGGVQQVISQLNQTMAWNKGMLDLFALPNAEVELTNMVGKEELDDLKEQAKLLQSLSDLLQRRLSRAGL